jgi:ribosomal-protein-alanine N-acetyltransferase
MIDNNEFYRRFDEIIPGAMQSKDTPMDSGSDIYFERLSMSGLEEMHRYSADERLYEFFEFDSFNTVEKTKTYIEKLLQRMSGDVQGRTAMYWFVRRRIDGYLVGTACLVELNYARKSIEWGYGVDPEQWGSGFILQIQECLKHYAFETLELNRLHGITMVQNHRTISSLLAAGMRHEGTLRDFYCKNGVYHDAWQYAMLKRDYFDAPRKHSIIERRFTIEDVIEVVSSVLTEEIVTFDTSMSNSLSWDSFSHMSIMIALSEKMGISLSPAEVTLATSVKAIVSLISKLDPAAL